MTSNAIKYQSYTTPSARSELDLLLFSDEGRSDGCGVLVHCLAGISRSVTVTVAYLMSQQGMTLDEAYDFVKKAKPNISPNFNFMGQLLDFEQTLKASKSSSSQSNRLFFTI